MSDKQDVTIRLDDRIRFMSALLAATNWPEQAQKRQPHGTHAHARATTKYLNEFRSHAAVKNLQTLLDQGAPLEAMYTFILCLSWPGLELEIDRLPGWVPPRWILEMRDFASEAQLDELWQQDDGIWQRSIDEAQRMFQGVAFKSFLEPFLGDISEEFIFTPNISYPTDQEIGVRLDKELLCIAPPRLAWGDSPPWPFDEDPAHIYRAALTQYGRLLLLIYLRAHAKAFIEAAQTPLPVSDQFVSMYPSWEEQFTALFVAAAVAIYLDDYVNKAEAKAYVLMARKAQGLIILPGTISVLRRYLSEHEAGRYHQLMDFLPTFPRHLRIAKRITTL